MAKDVNRQPPSTVSTSISTPTAAGTTTSPPAKFPYIIGGYWGTEDPRDMPLAPLPLNDSPPKMNRTAAAGV